MSIVSSRYCRTIYNARRHAYCMLTAAAASTLCPQKKQSQRIFSIILFKTDEIFFYKIWNTYFRVYLGHNCSRISNETCVIPLSETFWRLAELKRRLLVEWRKLDHSIVVAAISQWRRRLSACVRAHGGHYEHILRCFHGSVCWVNAEIFLNLGFYCLTVLFIAKI